MTGNHMSNPRKIIFRQGQSPGDILTITRALYDFCRAYPDYQVDIRTPCPELFDNNPYTTELSEDDDGVEIYTITYDMIHQSGRMGIHFADAFRFDIEEKVNSDIKMVEKWGKIEIPMTGLNPELFFTDDEKSWFNQIHCDYYWDGPFWLINAGRKSDNELKQYHRWQEVVNILNDYWQGKVRIVQIGSASGGGMEHIHPPLRGAFNLIAKTDLRQLLRLAYWSEGTIGPISFQFVIAAALDKPCVICAGGKEGTRWHIYNHVRWVNQNGCLPCSASDGCWLGGKKGDCKNLITPDDMDEKVPKCFEITTPKMLADAVIQYYNGGRLSIPDEEKWHVEDGENLDDVKAKFDRCYDEGRYRE